MRRMLKAQAIFLLLCGLSACQSGGEPPPPQAQVRSFPTMALTPQRVELRSEFPATLKGKDEVEVKPRLEGTIEAVYVNEGAHVRKGQPLFRINSPASAKDLQQAKAQYATASLDVERMRPLADKGIVSKVSLETYVNTLSSAEAALRQAKTSMGWVTVTSPVDGLVGTIDLRVGSLVNTASTLTTVSNTASVIARFSLSEKDLYLFLAKWKGATKAEKIRNIPEVNLKLSNGSQYGRTGRVATISGKLDQSTGSVGLQAVFPNPDGLLFSGSSATVVLPDHRDKAIVIPQKATFTLQDKVVVYVVENDKAIQRNIAVESLDGASYVVDSGLVAGERIVTEGIVNLSNGQKIKAK